MFNIRPALRHSATASCFKLRSHTSEVIGHRTYIENNILVLFFVFFICRDSDPKNKVLMLKLIHNKNCDTNK